MKFNLQTLKLQNFLSFGNSETVVEFNTGLNLITGHNGAGKSSILLDAISYVLFDKPYREINKPDLINRKNKKDLRVECDFEVNGVNYKIIRGMKNPLVELEFWIDGTKQELVGGGKTINQQDIESKIGIDYKLFKQILSLSINYNKPFLTLPAGEKRNLLEKFCNIDVIPLMLKNAKAKRKDMNIKKDMLIHSIDMLGDVIKSEKRHITELKTSKKTFDDDKKSEYDDIESKLVNTKKELKKLKSTGRKLKKEFDAIQEVEIKKLSNDKEDILNNISECKFKIKNANEILEALDKYDVCPTCNSSLTDEHKAAEIQIQTTILSENTKLLDKLSGDYDDITENITSARVIQDSKKDLMYSLKSIKSDIKIKTDELDRLNDELIKIENKEFVFNIDDMVIEYKAKIKEYNHNKQELEYINTELDKYEIVIDILSDNGVKSYIFNQLIPIMNNSINTYLRLFDLPVYIEFDNTMKHQISTTSNFNTSVKYTSFSEGEKKKIDMSILLSFIDVTKKIANWNCNLLIIDELLDSSIDDEGLDKLLESLNTMVSEENGMGIYIISHRLKSEYKNKFKSIIEVEKNIDGFSKINYTQEV